MPQQIGHQSFFALCKENEGVVAMCLKLNNGVQLYFLKTILPVGYTGLSPYAKLQSMILLGGVNRQKLFLSKSLFFDSLILIEAQLHSHHETKKAFTKFVKAFACGPYRTQLEPLS